MAEPIHLFKLPLKHKLTDKHLEDVILSTLKKGDVLGYDPDAAKWKNLATPGLWGRALFLTQHGTVGSDVFGGSGSDPKNAEADFRKGTGTTINSFSERYYTIPHYMNVMQEWECGFVPRTILGYCQTYFGIGNSYWVSSVREYTIEGTSWYAAFFFVRDATYTDRILTVTRNGANAEINDVMGFTLVTNYNIRIEIKSASECKFYVDNVLKATHTLYIPWYEGAGIPKFGISNQAAVPCTSYFKALRGIADYP